MSTSLPLFLGPIVFLFLSCEDTEKESVPPTSTITSPLEGESILEGRQTVFQGIVTNSNGPSTDLMYEWRSETRVLCESTAADATGIVDCENALTLDDTTITLSVLDVDGTSVEDTISIDVVPNNHPTVELIQPTNGTRYHSDVGIQFVTVVSDDETPATDIQISWSSSLDGPLDTLTGSPNDMGEFSGELLLSQGSHTISVLVEDSDNKTTLIEEDIVVLPPNQAPTCSLEIVEGSESVEGSSVVVFGNTITFEGTIEDADAVEEAFTVQWSSDLDGLLQESVIPIGDPVAFSTESLSINPHTITLTATDGFGGVCEQSIDVIVGTLPTVSIVSPTEQYIVDEGLPVVFEGLISDNEDSVLDVDINWTIDGYSISTAPTDENGITIFEYSVLPFGDHTVVLTATDSVGLSASTSVDFTVNGIPSAPTISLAPNPAFTDTPIVVTIDVDSIDPEGVTPQYTYTWFLENVLQSSITTNTLPTSATTQGDTWTVEVRGHDGITSSIPATLSTTIQNTPPTLSGIGLSPSGNVYNEDTVVCSVSVTDPDEGLTPSFAWRINGTLVGSTNTLNLDGLSVHPNDVVECETSVSDSQGASDQLNTSFTVANRSPTLTSVAIGYTDTLTSTSELTCTYVGSDEDLDPLSPAYIWTNTSTGTVFASTSHTLQLTPSTAGPNDSISCTVTLQDGIATSTPMTASEIVQNTPPYFSSAANIVATGTAVGDTWTCTSTGDDQDDGTLTASYSWQDHTGAILGSNADLELTATNTTPFESITCTATLTDTQGLTTQSSASLTVSNSVPHISTVAIDQSEIYTEDVVSVLVEYSDADENNDTTLLLDWYVLSNNSGQESLVQSGQSDTLDGILLFDKADAIRVEASVSDAFTTTTLSSSTVLVLNSPPSISQLSISPDPAYADFDELSCTAQASDLDGDALSYAFTWASAAGILHTPTVSTSNTTILDASSVTGEDWTCTVSVDDGVETSSDSTTITVNPSACDGISCGPDGACTNLGSTYSCSCRAGFEGTNCELDIDECAVNNGGCTGTRSDCINTMGGHYCIDSSTVLAFPESTVVTAETYYNVAVITVNGRDPFPTDPVDYLQYPNVFYRQIWYDTDQLGDILFDHPDGLKSFFTEISYGKANFQGVVVDWYDDYATTKTNNDLFNDRDFYFAESYDQIDPTQFDIFMLVGLVDTGVTQKGWGMGNSVPDEFGGRLNGKGITYLINSSFFNTVGQTRFDGWVLPSVPWVHEIFHTIGVFGHSNTLWCYPSLTDYQNAVTDEELHDNASEMLTDSCNIKGYGDPFSLMGERLWATHPSVASKIEMDWIPEDNKTNIDATGVFVETLVPLYPHNQSSVSDNIAIQIAVPPFDITTPGGFTLTFDRVTIETRVETGFDTYLSALGSGYRGYSNVAYRYLDTTYSWNSQYSAGIYDLIHPIDHFGAYVYIDSTTDSNEVVYLLDGHPSSQGVLTSQSSPKGHKGNAGKFADAMLNVGDTFASDVLPFTLSIETGPDAGINGDLNVRVTPVP